MFLSSVSSIQTIVSNPFLYNSIWCARIGWINSPVHRRFYEKSYDSYIYIFPCVVAKNGLGVVLQWEEWIVCVTDYDSAANEELIGVTVLESRNGLFVWQCCAAKEELIGRDCAKEELIVCVTVQMRNWLCLQFGIMPNNAIDQSFDFLVSVGAGLHHEDLLMKSY